MSALWYLTSPDHLRWGKQAKLYQAALLCLENPELSDLCQHPGFAPMFASPVERRQFYQSLQARGYRYNSRLKRWEVRQ